MKQEKLVQELKIGDRFIGPGTSAIHSVMDVLHHDKHAYIQVSAFGMETQFAETVCLSLVRKVGIPVD